MHNDITDSRRRIFNTIAVGGRAVKKISRDGQRAGLFRCHAVAYAFHVRGGIY